MTEAYGLNESQSVLVDEIAGVLDEIAALPKSATVERRQQRTLLCRLLGQLALPDVDGAPMPPPDPVSERARRAAKARWRKP